MRSTRGGFRAALTVAAAAAVAVAGLVTAQSAAASGDAVMSVYADDAGSVAVELQPGTRGVLWIEVSVRGSSSPDAPVLASTDDLTDHGDGTFRSRTPISLSSGTAYGDYPVDVDYRLASGTVEHWSGASHGAAGRFSYRLHTGVASVSFDRLYTDYYHRSATLSGTATTFDPATTTSSAAAEGTHVRVEWSATVGDVNHNESSTAVTGTDGAFSVPITPGGILRAGTATVVDVSADTQASAGSALPFLYAQALQVRYAATPDSVTRHAGKPFTVTGTAEQFGDNGWEPFRGARVVTATVPQNPYNFAVRKVIGSGDTDTRGTFSYDASSTRTTGFYTYIPQSPYLDSRSVAGGTLNVPTKGSFKRLKVSIDKYRNVTAMGTLHGNCSEQNVDLQYSPSRHGHWTRIARATSSDLGLTNCDFVIHAFGAVDGYYRVAHGESGQMLALTSSKHRLRRIETRISSFSISPANPSRNAPLTATGSVQEHNGRHWTGVGGARVGLVFQPRHDSTWYLVRKGTTDSSGHFSLAGKAYGTGEWGVYYAADKKHYYSQSEVLRVDVR